MNGYGGAGRSSGQRDEDGVGKFSAEGDFLTAVLEDERPSREPFDALHHRPLHEAEPDELRAQDALRQAMDARGISFGDGAEFHWVPFRAGAAFLHSPHSP